MLLEEYYNSGDLNEAAVSLQVRAGTGGRAGRCGSSLPVTSLQGPYPLQKASSSPL
jgi:hypothetical protein